MRDGRERAHHHGLRRVAAARRAPRMDWLGSAVVGAVAGIVSLASLRPPGSAWLLLAIPAALVTVIARGDSREFRTPGRELLYVFVATVGFVIVTAPVFFVATMLLSGEPVAESLVLSLAASAAWMKWSAIVAVATAAAHVGMIAILRDRPDPPRPGAGA